MLPAYFSLIVMFLNSRVNRYGPLIGSLNCWLYAYTYMHYGLYASAISSAAVLFPIQFVTFILWTKRKDGRRTKLRKMTTIQRIVVLAVSVIIWIAGLYILNSVGGSHSILDNSSTIIGLIVAFLTMFAYVEYTYLNILNGVMLVCLNLAVAIDQPEMTPYLIMGVYSFVCIIRGFFSARQIYSRQNSV